MSDLPALLHSILGPPPDVEAIGPLLDLLDSAGDSRAAWVRMFVGDLAQALDLLHPSRPAWEARFAGPLRNLFWLELNGGTTAALTLLARRLKPPGRKRRRSPAG